MHARMYVIWQIAGWDGWMEMVSPLWLVCTFTSVKVGRLHIMHGLSHDPVIGWGNWANAVPVLLPLARLTTLYMDNSVLYQITDFYVYY